MREIEDLKPFPLTKAFENAQYSFYELKLNQLFG
jgi:hypothetical protein